MIFENLLDTCPKMETHDPDVYPTILRGVSRGFWTLFLDQGTRSAIFWHLKTGTFGKSEIIKYVSFDSWVQVPSVKDNCWCLGTHILCLEICINCNISPHCDKAREL